MENMYSLPGTKLGRGGAAVGVVVRSFDDEFSAGRIVAAAADEAVAPPRDDETLRRNEHAAPPPPPPLPIPSP